jgi:hypothetical protein
MKSKSSTSQKIGWVVFALGALYMFGLGWLYSWRMVPSANQLGSAAYNTNLLGLFWAMSVPLGAFIVAIGAGLAARAGRRVIWSLVLLLVLTVAWKMTFSFSTMVPALFGTGGGLITLFFLGSTWQWAKIRPTLAGSARTGSDLRMIGYIFFVVAAWYLCGTFGMSEFVLRPELAQKFSVPVGNVINSALVVQILLVVGWGFTYLGQRITNMVHAAQPEQDKVRQMAAAD